jgi:DNA-binding SARP family transcriptional activator
MTFSMSTSRAQLGSGTLRRPCLYFGETLAAARIYLTGHVAIEHERGVVAERDLPGRQGRLAFVYLATERDRPISRRQLADVLWPDEAPRDSETALSAILSKLRRVLKTAGWMATDADVDVCSGSVSLRLPRDAWVDIEAAAHEVDQAEGALRAGQPAKAWGHANVAVAIGRRPYLPDFTAPWIEARRAALRDCLTRGLQCLAAVSAATGEPALAVRYASEVVTLEPFRETGYQSLMRLHHAMGDRAEALRVFGRCRELLRDELGTSPSPQTEAVFLEILREGER